MTAQRPGGLVIGVDVGTSSSKGVLVDPDGQVLCTVVREHAVSRPLPGQVEMDGALWWQEFVEIAAELTAAAAVAGRPIASVGVSGMGPCLLLADAAGTPLRPAILYGVDTRAGDQIERLNARFGREAIIERCGSALSSQAVGPKLAWVADNEPEVWAAARRFFMPASWLVWQLSGEYTLDHHSASQCTPLYDTEALDWHAPWSAELLGPIEPPRLAWPGEQAGTITDAAAAATGLPAGTPVTVGTIDAWTESISVDAHHPGDLMLMYGTTLFLINTSPSRVTHPALWGTVGVEPGTWNFAAGMATSGAITAWLRGLFGDPGYAELVAEAAAEPAGSRGLLMLPYFAGERTPLADPDARGMVLGLTLEHGRGALYRAALEATAFGIRHNVEEMRAAGAVIERIVAVGGGTQSTLWPQIVSDVTGLVQQLPADTIGASLGSARLAAGLLEGAETAGWNGSGVELHPNPANRAVYDELYRHYLELYPATRDTAHALAALQRSAARAGQAPV
ncbi:FGGY-family carbohydrate kinase [Microterricola viridarii]|uniref:Xylulokinase n=1 Tax=Microterricola viridarii TaxID=412690 RepID=A0A1H1RLK5_9MICO|nr:FGGY family carbohydrate kinase [Microterricola viridarii]SDS36595.1 xylulokinase [Microterricola viridarii]